MDSICFSYSNTETYNTCPEQFHKVNFLRIPEYQDTDNPASERGTLMHEEFEDCVNEDTDYSQPEYQWILDDFRAQTGLKIAEMQLAINRAWKPTKYDLGKHPLGKTIKNPEAWYRGKVDFTCINGTHIDVMDLKTGKRKFKDPVTDEGLNLRWLRDHWTGRLPNSTDVKYATDPDDVVLANARQANEYAVMMFAHFPQIETQTFKFVWSDVDGVQYDTFEFDRQRDMEQMLKTMLFLPTQISEAVEKDEWVPKPSGLCNGWCTVVGCKHWKPKRESR